MLAVLTALCLVAATADELPKLSADAAKEVKKFEGKWKGVKVVANGEEQDPKMDGMDTIVEFKERKLVLGDKELMVITAIDPSTDPKLIDLKAVMDMGGVTKDALFEGIYKIDGDTLTLAIHLGPDKKRPEKFESAKDSGVVLVTLQREKK